jgi:hypothetical protein
MYRYSRIVARQLEEASEVLVQPKGLQSGKLLQSCYFATRLLAGTWSQKTLSVIHWS